MSYYLNECETMQCQLAYMIQPFERDNCLEVSLIILIVSERILSRCGTRCVPEPIIFLGGARLPPIILISSISFCIDCI